MSKYFVILAAGKGNRFKSNIPKQYLYIYGKPILQHSIDKALKSGLFKKIIVVVSKSHESFLKKIKKNKVSVIFGGKERKDSTIKALNYIKKYNPKHVFIHDAARPFFSINLLKRLNKNLLNKNAIAPIVKINSSVKIIKNNNFKNFDRNKIVATQTPQCFKFKKLIDLYKLNKKLITDEISLFIDKDEKFKFIKGESNNIKITDANDLKINTLKTNYGIGFDVHRLIPGRKLFIGGIIIKSKFGTLGHSDGDPVLHAITDSLLGAMAKGDIGEKFSDKSKKYKNIRSTILLSKVVSELYNKKFVINNIDVNIIAQKPKLQKYKEKIKNSISKICRVDKDIINIKGKTTEKLGTIGKEKAIACEVITSISNYV